MLNRIVVAGKLGRDPEKRALPSGKSVTSFSLACERDFKNQEGTRDVDWIDIVSFGGTADFCASWFKKGSTAIVSGRLSMRQYTDKNGNKRTAAEVVADNVYFGDSKPQSTSDAHVGFAPAASVPADNFAVIDDEPLEQLPF